MAFFTNALTTAQIQQLYSAAGVPPVIVVQPPASIGANSGQTVSIPITAKGSTPLAYQWYRTNGTAVAGQTTAALTLNPIALANSGSVARPFTTIAVTVLSRPTAPYPVAVLNDHPADYFRLDESPDNGTGNNGIPAYDYAGGLNACYTNDLIAQPNSGCDSPMRPARISYLTRSTNGTPPAPLPSGCKYPRPAAPTTPYGRTGAIRRRDLLCPCPSI